MKAGKLVDDIAVDLNDAADGYTFVRWTRQQLISYVEEIYNFIADAFQDKYKSEYVVRVQHGSGWTTVDNCGCEKLVRVIGESDKHGFITRRLRVIEDDDNLSWIGSVHVRCADYPSDYAMDSVILSSTSDRAFRVTPPVPPTVEKYVKVECWHKATFSGIDHDIEPEYVAMIKQWVLSRALAIDSENNPAVLQLSENHKASFKDLFAQAIALADRERNDDRERSLRTVQKGSSDGVPRRTSV